VHGRRRALDVKSRFLEREVCGLTCEGDCELYLCLLCDRWNGMISWCSGAVSLQQIGALFASVRAGSGSLLISSVVHNTLPGR
jgi:hypothetical protein